MKQRFLMTDRSIELSVFEDAVIAARLVDTVLPAHRSVRVKLLQDSARERGRGYYSGMALRLSANDGQAEIGDGGFTNWTAQLMGNAKERCFVSCIATERLLDLDDGA